MESITLRQKLHHLIDTTSEDKLKDIYDSFQEEEYSEDFKAMLDNEYNTYQEDGEGIAFTILCSYLSECILLL